MDSPFLSILRTRSLEKSLVLLWLLTRCGRNVQRTALIRSAVFCPVAVVAKKMGLCTAHARRFRHNDSTRCFTVALAHSSRLGLRCCYFWCELAVRAAIQTAARNCVARWNYRLRGFCDRRSDRWKLCLVAHRFYLRHRTLPVPFHQLMLQPSVTAIETRLVIEGILFVGSSWLTAFASHTAMDSASALPRWVNSMRRRIGAAFARSRPARPDYNRRAVAADVRPPRSDA